MRVVMFLLSFILGGLLASIMVDPALGQERQVGVQAIYTHSPGTGHDNGVGVKTDVVVPIDKQFFAVLGELNWEVQPKSYIGDGWAWRGRLEGRIHFYDRREKWSPFYSVGLAASHQYTSQYDKGSKTWTMGAGVVYDQKVVGYWRHLFEEKQTANRASADEVGVELYWPLDVGSKWRVRASGSVINVRFTQPNGPYAGRHNVNAYQIGIGLGRVF